jgi:hypothetical protein
MQSGLRSRAEILGELSRFLEQGSCIERSFSHNSHMLVEFLDTKM